MEKEKPITPKIKLEDLASGVDIPQAIENEKTRKFVEEYDKLCKQYERMIVPTVQLIKMPKKDDNINNNTPNNSGNK